MRNYFRQIALIAMAATFLATTTLWARSSKANNHNESGQVTLIYASQIANGTELQPGSYKVELSPNASSPQLMFYQQGKLVAQAPVKLVAETKKIGQTEILYNTAANQHVITEIDLRAWSQAVKFPSSNAAAWEAK